MINVLVKLNLWMTLKTPSTSPPPPFLSLFTQFHFSTSPMGSATGKDPHFSSFFFRGPLLDWLGQIRLYSLTHTHTHTNKNCNKTIPIDLILLDWRSGMSNTLFMFHGWLLMFGLDKHHRYHIPALSYGNTGNMGSDLVWVEPVQGGTLVRNCWYNITKKEGIKENPHVKKYTIGRS